MLPTLPAGALRQCDRSIHPEGLRANAQGGGDPVVRVWDLFARAETLREAPGCHHSGIVILFSP